MKKIKVKVNNKFGLHARPASMLVKKALDYDADITVEDQQGVKVSGKSIMGLMTLAASCGSQLNIIADGEDEEPLLEELRDLFDSNFKENE